MGENIGSKTHHACNGPQSLLDIIQTHITVVRPKTKQRTMKEERQGAGAYRQGNEFGRLCVVAAFHEN